MRLIDADKLKNALLIRFDDLEDLGLLDDAKSEVSKKVIEMFVEQFDWQTRQKDEHMDLWSMDVSTHKTYSLDASARTIWR